MVRGDITMVGGGGWRSILDRWRLWPFLWVSKSKWGFVEVYLG